MEEYARWIGKRLNDRLKKAIIAMDGEVTGPLWMSELRGVNAKSRLVSTRYDEHDQGRYSLTPLGQAVRAHLLGERKDG